MYGFLHVCLLMPQASGTQNFLENQHLNFFPHIRNYKTYSNAYHSFYNIVVHLDPSESLWKSAIMATTVDKVYLRSSQRKRLC